MSAQESPSQWYIASTGSGTVDYPAASHGVTATFASSAFAGGKIAILDSVSVTKAGTDDTLTFVDGAGSTLFTMALATAAGVATRVIYTPNGIEMGKGFGAKLTATDWKVQISYRFI